MTSYVPQPPSNRRMAGRIAVWTAIATVGALTITGVALAASVAATGSAAPSATPSASSSEHPGAKPPGKPPGKGHGHGRGLAHAPGWGRTVHGEAVVKTKDGKFVTVYTQRGAVTAVSSTSITVKSADGYTATYAVNADTKVGKDHKPAKIGDIKLGDMVGVVATKSGDTKTAKGVRAGDRGQPKDDD